MIEPPAPAHTWPVPVGAFIPRSRTHGQQPVTPVPRPRDVGASKYLRHVVISPQHVIYLLQGRHNAYIELLLEDRVFKVAVAQLKLLMRQRLATSAYFSPSSGISVCKSRDVIMSSVYVRQCLLQF